MMLEIIWEKANTFDEGPCRNSKLKRGKYDFRGFPKVTINRQIVLKYDQQKGQPRFFLVI